MTATAGCSSIPPSPASAKDTEAKKRAFYLNLKDGRVVSVDPGKAETAQEFDKTVAATFHDKDARFHLVNAEASVSFPKEAILGYEVESTPATGRSD